MSEQGGYPMWAGDYYQGDSDALRAAMTDTPKPVEQWTPAGRFSIHAGKTLITAKWMPGTYSYEAEAIRDQIIRDHADAAALREQVQEMRTEVAKILMSKTEMMVEGMELRERLDVAEKKAALADRLLGNGESVIYSEQHEAWDEVYIERCRYCRASQSGDDYYRRPFPHDVDCPKTRYDALSSSQGEQVNPMHCRLDSCRNASECFFPSQCEIRNRDQG